MAQLRELMAAFRAGDNGAGRQLMEMFYPELRKLAASKMRKERAFHTWEPTTLVNELYLEMMKLKELGEDRFSQNDKAAFFGLASHLMKRLLIHHARPLSRRIEKLELREDQAVTYSNQETLHEIDRLMQRLESIHPRLRSVVEMRVFEGCTVDQIAERLSCSPVTVARSWRFAKKWLQDQMQDNSAL